jgi:hypothetical protein
MIFQEVGPNENLDVRRFSSAPFGLGEAGILKMGWGKARVRLMPVRQTLIDCDTENARRHDSDFKAR